MGEVKQLQPGEVFARRYQVEKPLKAGGMGAVYVVRHIETGKRLALKVMQPEIVAKPELRQRFLQEAQISARIDEPDHIVDVQDAGVDDATGNPFIVMELLVGEDLSEVLTQRTMGPEELIPILRHVCAALDAAHAKGVVHRDLKPENIYLVQRPNKPMVAKVLDFGIAKIVQNAAATSTMTGGTPLYMAPEQTKRAAQIGAPTDIWPIGLIAYRALVGRVYWEADDIHGLFGEILVGQYESAVSRAARAGVQLPPDFDTFFLRCVALRPEMRFQQASQAIEALAGVFGRPTLAIPSSGQRGSLPNATVYAAPQLGGTPTPGSAGTPRTPGPMSGSDPNVRASNPPQIPSGSHPSNPHVATAQMQSQPEIYAAGGTALGTPGMAQGYPAATQVGSMGPYGMPTAPGVSSTAPGAQHAPPPGRAAKKGSPLPFVLAGLAAAGLAAGGVYFALGGDDGGSKKKKKGGDDDPPKAASVTPDPPPSQTGAKLPPSGTPSGGPVVVNSDDWRLEADKLNPWVQLDGMKLHKHEVTRAEYAKYLAAQPEGMRAGLKPLDDWRDEDAGRARQPVVWVTWEQADKFCRALGARLPTAIEWGASVGNIYPWGDAWPSSVAGIAVGLPDGTAPLDAGASSKDVTKDGVQDLGGNVQEWTSTVKDGLARVKGGAVGMTVKEAKPAITEGLSKPSQTVVGAAKEAIASSSVGFRCLK